LIDQIRAELIKQADPLRAGDAGVYEIGDAVPV